MDEEAEALLSPDVAAARLASVVLGDNPLPAVAGLISELAGQVIASAAATSVTMVRDANAWTPGASDELARRLDDVQYASRRGPCLAAAREGVAANVVLATSARRWPELAQAGSDCGFGSVMSVPLTVGEGRVVGGLNVYAKPDAPFDDDEAQVASRFARHAAVLLTNAATLAEATVVNAQLQEALASRDIIGQAKGILMARESCSADDAFAILRRASQRTNRKLRDIAADIVATAQSRRRRA